ncbi:HlyD family secretion protein [Aureimonas sp. SA4125]|uniref:HlyD family secretion protein n=1 Tax=Aureimonas sp. SA4125 TaxID=2826993 RepID=UPI001CC578C8|nr:HlyD family secretion protein [Aureimonas sp. SA4125]
MGADGTTRKKPGRKKFVLAAALLAALSGGAYFGHFYWTEGRFLVSTDDAYVGADMSIVSPKITGYVESVPVEENQVVRAGQPLVVIDAGDFELALETAEAKIATQHASIERIAAQRDAAEAQLGEASASRAAVAVALDKAELDLSRASDLVKSGAGTKAGRDTAQSTRDSAAANIAGADATIAAARANVAVLDAQRKEAERTVRELEIARDQAKRDLTFTTINAPYDGVVGNLSVEPGDLVSSGKRLAAVVPVNKAYIDANFKETQLGDLVPGQKVRIELDSAPGQEFEGTITSLSPASGSVFSLLPSDNATGNFTKVVQRVPVRIAIDDAERFAGTFRPGLSAEVAVDIRTVPVTTAQRVDP